MPTLIIDSGGTKAHWALIDHRGQATEGHLAGLHPFFLTSLTLRERLKELRVALSDDSVEEIHFYGAGTSTSDQQFKLVEAFEQVFPKASVHIHSDLLAVARSLFSHAPGLVAILGTGSNVGRYDGNELVATAGGLGYILGDEGSGADLGKTLLNYYLNNRLPTAVADDLRRQYQLSRQSIIDAVYRKTAPNRYLASFAPFLAQHLHEAAIIGLVSERFRIFLTLYVLPLQDPGAPLPLSCSGSIAYHFRQPLQLAAEATGITLGKLVATPMPGLLEYHTRT